MARDRTVEIEGNKKNPPPPGETRRGGEGRACGLIIGDKNKQERKRQAYERDEVIIHGYIIPYTGEPNARAKK